MRNVRFFVALLLFGSMTSSAQSLDELAATVVFLSREKAATVVLDGITYEQGLRKPGTRDFVPRTRRVGGTGFFVGRESSLFLVTARHVAVEMDAHAQVTLRTDQQAPTTVGLQDLSGAVAELTWRTHPTEDVAALMLKPPARLMPLLREHFFPAAWLASDPPSRDVILTVLGFPLALGTQGAFSPLSRETKLAGGPITISETGTVLVLQDPSVGGFSGAPVLDLGHVVITGSKILARGGGVSCVGLIQGTFSDDTGGKFAVVVPSARILELLPELVSPPHGMQPPADSGP